MTHLIQQHRLKLFFPLLLSVIIMAGCASLPPSKNARDLNEVAGKWEGTMQLRNGRVFPATLTIAQDGRYESLVPGLGSPGPRFVGTISLEDGKYRWKSETSGASGTYTLHEGDGKRMLVGADDNANHKTEFYPAK
jgi:hypothetical protein